MSRQQWQGPVPTYRVVGKRNGMMSRAVLRHELRTHARCLPYAHLRAGNRIRVLRNTACGLTHPAGGTAESPRTQRRSRCADSPPRLRPLGGPPRTTFAARFLHVADDTGCRSAREEKAFAANLDQWVGSSGTREHEKAPESPAGF